MITRRHLLFAVLATSLLTMFLITLVPVRSLTSGQYDPWLDVNDDGWIDGGNLIMLARAFGTSGAAINKTDLLLNLQSEIDSLNSSLLNLENTVANQQTTITNQQSEINNLGAQLATKLGAPDYDSGAFQINPAQTITITHNLGTINVLVEMVGCSYAGGPVHQVEYGGDLNGAAANGAYWFALSTTTINIYRMVNDANWPFIRVYMWKIYK